VAKFNLKQSCFVIVVPMLVDHERHLMMKTQQTINAIACCTADSVW